MRYIQKSVVVEAFQYKPNYPKNTPNWVNDTQFGITLKKSGDKLLVLYNDKDYFWEAEYNDYIIKNIDGRVTVCKPDIFRQMYDPLRKNNEFKHI